MADPDADRFTRIYEANFRRVLGYAMRRTSLDAAREATAEAFLVAWRRRADVPEPALPWLLAVTRNVIGDQHRGGRRADVLLAEVERLTGSRFQPDPSSTARSSSAQCRARRRAVGLRAHDRLRRAHR